MSLFRRMLQSRSLAAVALACMVTVALVSVTKAGIQGSGIRRVTAFGTISPGSQLTVNGVVYDATDATVVLNGSPGKTSSLHAGHIVSIKGTEEGSKSRADEITLVSEVRGEITAVDARARTLTVLGQVVRVSEGAGAFQPGMLVTVSGFADAQGIFNASSIDVEASQFAAQVKGVVEFLDRERALLRIGNLTVDYSSAGIQGTIAEGVTVIAKGVAVGHDNMLSASSIEVYRGFGEPGSKGNLEGIITAFASEQDFDVNGQQVLGDADTKYILHGTQLGPNVQVRVKGRFDAAGVLVADKIQAEKPSKKK